MHGLCTEVYVMSVSVAFGRLVGSLDVSSAEAGVLVASGVVLALEVDLARVPDGDGKTKSAAGAVRELRSVVAELVLKGSDGDGEGDWTGP